MAVATAKGTPMATAMSTCSTVPTMAWRMPTWASALGSATWKFFWSLVNRASQWIDGRALYVTHATMKRTMPITSRAALTTITATTRSVATWRSMTCAMPSHVSARNPTYQQTRNPRPPDSEVSW